MAVASTSFLNETSAHRKIVRKGKTHLMVETRNADIISFYVNVVWKRQDDTIVMSKLT